jgi:hypothetical protein
MLISLALMRELKTATFRRVAGELCRVGSGSYDPDPDFAKTLSDQHRALITGERKFQWKRKLRDLATPAQSV